MAGREKDESGAETHGMFYRDAGTDAEGPGFIRCGKDDAARSRCSAYGAGAAAEVGSFKEFDGKEEGVQVYMQTRVGRVQRVKPSRWIP
jgi:hypothetical protein